MRTAWMTPELQQKARSGVYGAGFTHSSYILESTTNATEYCMLAANGNGRI